MDCTSLTFAIHCIKKFPRLDIIATISQHLRSVTTLNQSQCVIKCEEAMSMQPYHDTYDTLLMQKAITAHEHIYKYKYNHIQDSKLHTEQYHLHKIHVMECL